jgi:FKBP-type peptidyl-prolyl cis-trans isomerase SlyD
VKIAKDSVVELDYSLHLGDGQVVDSSTPGDPLSYLHGQGQIVPGLERSLEGMEAGQSKKVEVAPEDGYGPREPNGLQEVARKDFPPDRPPEAGMEYTIVGPTGEPVPFTVTEVKGETVVIDLNHPFAGKTLHFEITVREVRAATAEELEHGHAHGAGGHH